VLSEARPTTNCRILRHSLVSRHNHSHSTPLRETPPILSSIAPVIIMACMCVAPAAAGLGARVSLAPRRARASVRVMAKKPKFNAPEISLPAVDLDAEQLEVGDCWSRAHALL